MNIQKIRVPIGLTLALELDDRYQKNKAGLVKLGAFSKINPNPSIRDLTDWHTRVMVELNEAGCRSDNSNSQLLTDGGEIIIRNSVLVREETFWVMMLRAGGGLSTIPEVYRLIQDFENYFIMSPLDQLNSLPAYVLTTPMVLASAIKFVENWKPPSQVQPVGRFDEEEDQW